MYRSVDVPSLHYDFFLNLTAKGIYGYNQTIFYFSPKISHASTTLLNDTQVSYTLDKKTFGRKRSYYSKQLSWKTCRPPLSWPSNQCKWKKNSKGKNPKTSFGESLGSAEETVLSCQNTKETNIICFTWC